VKAPETTKTTKKSLCALYAEVLWLRQIVQSEHRSLRLPNAVTFAPGFQTDLPRSDCSRADPTINVYRLARSGRLTLTSKASDLAIERDVAFDPASINR
jgi:hypothetical protein